MAQDFVKGKKVCELPLDDQAKLLVYLDREYDDHYFDSALYFFDGKKEYQLIHDSFAFTIGKNLYARIHCIHEFAGENFAEELSHSASQEFFDKTGKLYELSECVNYDMYLYRENGKVHFLLNKINMPSDPKNIHVIHEKIYETEVSEIHLSKWREILEKEFIPKYIGELKKINQEISEEQIQEAFIALRSGNL